MKLWYFYYSTGDCKGLKFDKKKVTNNKWCNQLWTEGQYNLFRELVKRNVIDGCSVVIESGIDSGYKQLCSEVNCYVVPRLTDIEPYINDNDILFMRGGWKSWINTIEKFVAEERNLLFYAANTGRGRWPYWNIVADDLHDYNYTGRDGRLYWYYRKPMNQDIFHYDPNVEIKHDLMIGASHITDKKGQWRVIEMLVNLKTLYGFNPKSVLPGALRRGTHTNELIANIKKYNLNVDLVGMLPREQLADLMRSTRVFFHAGAGGQNDRGALEAMACGMYVGIHSPKYHAPLVYKNKNLTFISRYNEIHVAAWKLYGTLILRKDRQAIADYFNEECGINICVKDFTKLINILVDNPKRNSKELLKHYDLATQKI